MDVVFLDLTNLIKHKCRFFSMMLTRAEYGIHVCLVVNPKRELEFNFYGHITLEKPFLHCTCLLLKNYATSILLASAFELVMAPNISSHSYVKASRKRYISISNKLMISENYSIYCAIAMYIVLVNEKRYYESVLPYNQKRRES